MFLHVLQDKNGILIHNRWVYARNDHILFVITQQHDKKQGDQRIDHCIFIALVSLVFPVKLQNITCEQRFLPCPENQIGHVRGTVQRLKKEVVYQVIVRKNTHKVLLKGTGADQNIYDDAVIFICADGMLCVRGKNQNIPCAKVYLLASDIVCAVSGQHTGELKKVMLMKSGRQIAVVVEDGCIQVVVDIHIL